MRTEAYYSCCGKSICSGCVHSFHESGNNGNCPFCKSEIDKTDGESVEELMKRVEANDAGSIYLLGSNYYHGQLGLQQDRERAIELWTQAADLGSTKSYSQLGAYYRAEGGDSKKSKFHYEAAAMAGHENARSKLGCMEGRSRNIEQAVKHWVIAASAGEYDAMHNLTKNFEQGWVSRDTIDSTLTAYNSSCAEMRSEARDAVIRIHSDGIT